MDTDLEAFIAFQKLLYVMFRYNGFLTTRRVLMRDDDYNTISKKYTNLVEEKFSNFKKSLHDNHAVLLRSRFKVIDGDKK